MTNFYAIHPELHKYRQTSPRTGFLWGLQFRSVRPWSGWDSAELAILQAQMRGNATPLPSRPELPIPTEIYASIEAAFQKLNLFVIGKRAEFILGVE